MNKQYTSLFFLIACSSLTFHSSAERTDLYSDMGHILCKHAEELEVSISNQIEKFGLDFQKRLDEEREYDNEFCHQAKKISGEVNQEGLTIIIECVNEDTGSMHVLPGEGSLAVHVGNNMLVTLVERDGIVLLRTEQCIEYSGETRRFFGGSSIGIGVLLNFDGVIAVYNKSEEELTITVPYQQKKEALIKIVE